MTLPSWLHFFQRTFPSANMVLLKTKRTLLYDTGFGSDIARTEQHLRRVGSAPEAVDVIVNSHYHCDHVGGNGPFQERYGTQIAAHHLEAEQVNHRHPNACDGEWLGQWLAPYDVDYPLSDGDEIDLGETVVQVLHTPGHCIGHISLYLPEEQILLAGDTIHANDVAWPNTFNVRDAFATSLETLERLAALPIRWACSGHGPAIENPQAAFDRARRRYERWQKTPQSIGWHACKRILAYALMLRSGLSADELTTYLLTSAWYHDYSRHVFESDPEEFIKPLLKEMLRSGAAAWHDGKLMAQTPYHAPSDAWLATARTPSEW